MHEEGLFSRRIRLTEPESLICPADGAASAAPSELLSAELRKVRLRLLREQARPEDPSLRQLLDSTTQAQPRSPPSVTVVLEFRSAAALCRQLEGLLHQTVKAHAIWVSDFQSADGGAEASRLVASLDPSPNPHPQPSPLTPHPSPLTPHPSTLTPTLGSRPNSSPKPGAAPGRALQVGHDLSHLEQRSAWRRRPRQRDARASGPAGSLPDGSAGGDEAP